MNIIKLVFKFVKERLQINYDWLIYLITYRSKMKKIKQMEAQIEFYQKQLGTWR